MKKFIAFIIVTTLVCFGLFKIYSKIVDEKVDDIKDTKENIDTAKRVVAENSAHTYIKAVEASLISHLFNTDIIDGTYYVDGKKIVNKENSDISYEIAYRGELPTKESIIYIEKGVVSSAKLYINDYLIEYNGNQNENNVNLK